MIKKGPTQLNRWRSDDENHWSLISLILYWYLSTTAVHSLPSFLPPCLLLLFACFLPQFHLTMTALLRSLIPRAHVSFRPPFNSRSFSSTSVNSHKIDLNFTPKQLKSLQSIAQHWQPEDAWCDAQALKLTRHDALSAYLVTLQNRCLSEPIHTLVNLTEYRNRRAMDPRPASGENSVYVSAIDLSSARDLASISRAIRRSMAVARSQEITRETYIMLNGTRQNKIVPQLHGRLNVSPGPTAAWVNSQSFLSLGQGVLARLGLPDYTQLYNEVSEEQMFTISPAMPVDGSRTRNDGHVVVSLRVPDEIRDWMADIMADDMRRLGRGCEMLLPDIQDRITYEKDHI
ncbi:hypothetical protein C8R43DRAFT_1047970 [Mycena crocata]|nr:hypothetical protein C8R43DRAFT_1047970 [Mycena crocata]